jgi:RND family efflux transporter MFP subunit
MKTSPIPARLLAVACTLLVTGCNAPNHATPPPPRPAPLPAAAPATVAPVPAEAPRPSPDDALVVTGDLKPSEAAELSFKAGGQMSVRRAVRGDLVAKGQVLGQLSDVEAQAQLAQAEAAVAMAKAQAAIAEDQAQRVESLRTADAAPGNAAVATRLQVEAARAGVRQAEAAASLARANVANHVLRAPFDGVVTRAPEGIGGTVGPGYPVYRLERLDPLLLVGTVAEAELERVVPGAAVVVDTSNGPVEGTVRAVVRALEPVSRRVPVEILVPNPDQTIVAGGFVRARLGAGAPPRPETAPATRREGAEGSK